MAYKIIKKKNSTVYEYGDGTVWELMDNPLLDGLSSLKEGEEKIVTDEDILNAQMKMLSLCKFEIMDFGITPSSVTPIINERLF